MDLNSVKTALNNVVKNGSDKPTLTGDGKLDKLRQSLQKTMDSMSSDDQLNMISLQSAVSKQNNAVEMMSTILKKFADLKDSIVRNF
jgi:Na+/citrate or Na+/malate symporter